MIDRASAYLSKAQRLLGAARAAEAGDVLRAGLAVAPADWGLHLYLGVALADAGQPDKAQAAFAEAERLAPANGAIPLFAAGAHLDHRRPDRAREALARARAPDPENPVVAAYDTLARYVIDPGIGIEIVLAAARIRPSHFKARLLLAVDDEARRARGAAAGGGRVAEPKAPAPRPAPRSGFAEWRRRRAADRWRRRIEDSVKRENHLRALELIRSATASGADLPDESVANEKKVALAGAARTLEQDLKALGTGAKVEAERRALLCLLADVRIEEGDRAGATSRLEAWLASFRGSGEPAAEQGTAAAVKVELARLELEAGRPEKALALCREAAKHAAAGDFIEGRAAAAAGDRIRARRAFERAARSRFFSLEDAIAEVTRRSPV